MNLAFAGRSLDLCEVFDFAGGDRQCALTAAGPHHFFVNAFAQVRGVWQAGLGIKISVLSSQGMELGVFDRALDVGDEAREARQVVVVEVQGVEAVRGDFVVDR